MRQLRVAYLPSSLRPGGAERQMLDLAERLPRDRFTVDFVVLSGPGEYDARAKASGAAMRFIGTIPAPAAPLPGSAARRAGKLLRYAQVARRERYDIIDAWLYPSDVLAALMKPFTRTPVVISGRRNIDPQVQFGRLERPIAALAASLTDAVVANSTAVARHAIERHHIDPTKLRIIRNGVEPCRDLPHAERAAIRLAMGVSDDEILIGCVANYLPVKRHSRLIDAFGELVAEGHRVRLVLVGEGPMRAGMERQIHELGLESLVRLHGSVPDARPMYGIFDISAQASCREGMPNALLEAAAAGCAIVATDAGGSREIVLDGQTGLLVSVDDPSQLTQALRKAVVDPGLRVRLGGAAREHSVRAFGMDRFVAEFVDLYERLAAAKRQRL